MNPAGQKLIEKIITLNLVIIDLTRLNDRIYFITVTGNTERWAGKLVKNYNF
ncbi:MAG: hypothetical protein IT241_01285 [Bacteroidia bacterium]|nr:hypothetical protein [Bacteroidia bacterium]